jgi:hypothetical protein
MPVRSFGSFRFRRERSLAIRKKPRSLIRDASSAPGSMWIALLGSVLYAAAVTRSCGCSSFRFGSAFARVPPFFFRCSSSFG